MEPPGFSGCRRIRLETLIVDITEDNLSYMRTEALLHTSD